MTYPDNRTMAVLAHMLEAEGMHYHEGMDALSVVVRGVPYRCEFEQYDELERRGWVRCEGERVDVTEAGRYWCRRWLKQNRARCDSELWDELARRLPFIELVRIKGA